MVQAAVRQASYDEIISCPAFRSGYDHAWRGSEPRLDRRWGDDEQLSYERGRQFGIYVKAEYGEHVTLSKGGLPHSRAKLLLMMAFRSGDVL